MRRKLILNSSKVFILPEIFVPQLIWIILEFSI